MPKIKLSFEEIEAPPERVEPEGGWKEPCKIEDHKWELEIEEGQVNLTCKDPHPESFVDECDPSKWPPICYAPYWEREDLFMDMKGIPVTVTHIDDSSPAGPWGPAEYGFYIEVKPVEKS